MSTTASPLSTSATEMLAQSLRGELIGKNDSRYDDARQLYNAMIDKRPALIAQCVDVADVISCVRFAANEGIELAIRGGGHNGGGLGSVEGGLVIDLSSLRGVRVDLGPRPRRRDWFSRLLPRPPRPAVPGRAAHAEDVRRRLVPHRRSRRGADDPRSDPGATSAGTRRSNGDAVARIAIGVRRPLPARRSVVLARRLR